MLTHPFLDIAYNPSVGYLLGGIDVYDQEESLGESLWGLDPNSDDREKIIREYIIPYQSYLSYKHKFVLLNKLSSALKDKDFDFSVFFGVDVDSHTATAWDASEVETPRSFFELKTALRWQKKSVGASLPRDLLNGQKIASKLAPTEGVIYTLQCDIGKLTGN